MIEHGEGGKQRIRIVLLKELGWVQGDSDVGGAFMLLGGCRKERGGVVVD